jgi:hypothetical protein
LVSVQFSVWNPLRCTIMYLFADCVKKYHFVQLKSVNTKGHFVLHHFEFGWYGDDIVYDDI